MLIVGAKGFAKEVLQILYDNSKLEDLVFYDDINDHLHNKLFNKFPILTNPEEAKMYFSQYNTDFSLGVGNPLLRKRMAEKFIMLGGKLVSIISKNAKIGTFDVFIENGVIILDNVCISNSVKIGEGSMIYYNSIITHDCVLGEYVEVAPSVSILGRATIGDFTQIGANATILPDINIGRNVIIGAGAVVTKDIPDDSVAMGVPAKISRTNL